MLCYEMSVNVSHGKSKCYFKLGVLHKARFLESYSLYKVLQLHLCKLLLVVVSSKSFRHCI